MLRLTSSSRGLRAARRQLRTLGLHNSEGLRNCCRTFYFFNKIEPLKFEDDEAQYRQDLLHPITRQQRYLYEKGIVHPDSIIPEYPFFTVRHLYHTFAVFIFITMIYRFWRTKGEHIEYKRLVDAEIFELREEMLELQEDVSATASRFEEDILRRASVAHPHQGRFLSVVEQKLKAFVERVSSEQEFLCTASSAEDFEEDNDTPAQDNQPVRM